MMKMAHVRRAGTSTTQANNGLNLLDSESYDEYKYIPPPGEQKQRIHSKTTRVRLISAESIYLSIEEGD